MEGENELTTFLKNTAKALRSHTVEELNAAMVSVLKNGSERREEIEHVLGIVADHYGISKRTLVHSNSRGNTQRARYHAYLIFHFDLGMNTRFIAQKIFNKWQNSISVAILYYKRLDTAIKTDKEFLDIYELLQNKVKTTRIGMETNNKHHTYSDEDLQQTGKA